MKTGILNCQQHSTVVSAATTDDTLDTDQCLLIGYDEKILTPEERREGEEGRGGEGVTERERERVWITCFPSSVNVNVSSPFLKVTVAN